MRQKLHKLLGHCRREQLAEGGAGEDGGGPGRLPGEGLPSGAPMDLHGPVPAGPGAGALAHLCPSRQSCPDLLVGPVSKLLNY